MKIRTALLTMTAAASLGAAQVHACDFNAADAQKDFDKAEVVFTGGASAVKHMQNDKHNADQPEYKTTFNADKIYKGHAGGAVDVVQMHDAWGHYISFNTGKEYLILAGRNDFGVLIDGCSPVMSLDHDSARSDEPGPEYKAAMEKILKADGLFPELPPMADKKGGKAASHETEKDGDDKDGN